MFFYTIQSFANVFKSTHDFDFCNVIKENIPRQKVSEKCFIKKVSRVLTALKIVQAHYAHFLLLLCDRYKFFKVEEVTWKKSHKIIHQKILFFCVFFFFFFKRA